MNNTVLLTVSQLNTYIKAIIDEDKALNSVYVKGEISNFTNHYKSGHLYLTLKDEKSLIRAVMFKSYASKLKFTPQNGMKVIVRARVSVYERDGLYQLYIEQMQPDGIGELSLAFEQLKNKLLKEGLFDPKRKKPIPKYPQRIGIITSETGAAVQDIKNVLSRRYPLATLVMCYVLVQGDGAPPQIIDAIERFNKLKAADVLIVGRGGGSLEDLWAFNDEGVARAVAASQIPVISAVGHEVDYTICDFAADLRAPTPSAAAELAVPDINWLTTYIDRCRASIINAVRKKVEGCRAELERLKYSRALQSPMFYIEDRRMALDGVTDKLLLRFKNICEKQRFNLSQLAAKLNVLSPLQVLSRGYGIAFDGNDIVKSVSMVEEGKKINFMLCDGILESIVTDIVKKEHVCKED